MIIGFYPAVLITFSQHRVHNYDER